MTVRRSILLLIVWSFAMAFPGAAQQPAPDKLSMTERAWMASKIYSSVQTYFGHWQAVPDLDLDAAYQKYLSAALASDDRRAFDLATMEFFASLENGHSGFGDPWLNSTFGKPLGFVINLIDGKWVVIRSRGDQLKVGDVVRTIDGQSLDEFYQQKRKYLAASNESARRQRLVFSPFLWPEQFMLTLDDGRTVKVDRNAQQLAPTVPPVTEGRLLEPNIAYLRIRSFGVLEEERKAVAFVKEHASVPNLIIDVRGNGGGSTPSELIAALMDRPYREMTESTSASIALFGAYRQLLKIIPVDQMSERNRGALEAVGGYANPQLAIPGELRRPVNPLYHGRVLILIDGECASACEDFVSPFKVSGRGQLIGEATLGSTGQPFMYTFANGMNFRISTKRTSFPDGAQFEGVGVTPDLALRPTITELREGNDVVLKKALELARK